MNFSRTCCISLVLLQLPAARAAPILEAAPPGLISEAELPSAATAPAAPAGRDLKLTTGWREEKREKSETSENSNVRHGSSSSSSSSRKRSTDHPTLFPTMTPTMAPTMTPTMAPTMTPTMSPTMSPTFCGKAAKSWYYDDDFTSGKSGKSTGTSGKSGKSTGTSGKSGKSSSDTPRSDCTDGSRPSTKGGKSTGTSGKSGKSSSDDRRRLRRGAGAQDAADAAAPRAPAGDRRPAALGDIKVRRRKIQGGK